MNWSKIANITFILGIIIFLVGAITQGIYENNNSDNEVPCYDSNDNVIKGVTCYGVIGNSLFSEILVGLGFLFIGLAIMIRCVL